MSEIRHLIDRPGSFAYLLKDHWRLTDRGQRQCLLRVWCRGDRISSWQAGGTYNMYLLAVF